MRIGPWRKMARNITRRVAKAERIRTQIDITEALSFKHHLFCIPQSIQIHTPHS